MVMSAMNSRLQLAILNRKKGRNLVEKGFTLVELMIVIVIVGVLSAVALPNFLGQSVKAKATECNTKAGAIMGQVAAEHFSSSADAAALLASEITTNNTNSKYCNFTDAGLTAPKYGLDIIGKVGSDIAGKYDANACVDADTGKRDLTYKTVTSGTPKAAAADCS